MNEFIRYIKRSKIRRYFSVILGIVLVSVLMVFVVILSVQSLDRYVINKKTQKQKSLTTSKHLICDDTILSDFIVTPLGEEFVVESKTNKIYMKYDCKPITLNHR